MTGQQGRYQDKVIVITGASSGIGKQVAIDFAKKRVKGVAIVARNRDRLNQLASEIQDKCECLVCPCDVSDKSAVISMASNVLKKFGNIDVLVNNAGYGILGKVDAQSVDDMEAVTATNYFGMIYCTKAFLSSMLARKKGHIVNVASLAGKFWNTRTGCLLWFKICSLGFLRVIIP